MDTGIFSFFPSNVAQIGDAPRIVWLLECAGSVATPRLMATWLGLCEIAAGHPPRDIRQFRRLMFDRAGRAVRYLVQTEQVSSAKKYAAEVGPYLEDPVLDTYRELSNDSLPLIADRIWGQWEKQKGRSDIDHFWLPSHHEYLLLCRGTTSASQLRNLQLNTVEVTQTAVFLTVARQHLRTPDLLTRWRRRGYSQSSTLAGTYNRSAYELNGRFINVEVEHWGWMTTGEILDSLNRIVERRHSHGQCQLWLPSQRNDTQS